MNLQGYKTYFTAAAMLVYAALAVFVMPPPYHLDLDAGMKIVFAAAALIGLRSGMSTEIQKIIAALGIDVTDGNASTPVKVQMQNSPLVRAIRVIASPPVAKVLIIGLFIAIAAPTLIACSTFSVVTPKTPSQTVYEAKGLFAAALAVADQYAVLPTCPDQAPICKTASVLAAVKADAHATKDSLDAADLVVNDPAWGTDKTTAAANAALSAATAFQAVTADLKTK